MKVPIFNVVDENDSTQEKLAKAVAEVWGVKYGFLNSTVATLVQQFAKVSPAGRKWSEADDRRTSQRWWRISMRRSAEAPASSRPIADD